MSHGQVFSSLGLTYSQVKVKGGLAWQLPASQPPNAFPSFYEFDMFKCNQSSGFQTFIYNKSTLNIGLGFLPWGHGNAGRPISSSSAVTHHSTLWLCHSRFEPLPYGWTPRSLPVIQGDEYLHCNEHLKHTLCTSLS